jgi:hypothetical protein
MTFFNIQRFEDGFLFFSNNWRNYKYSLKQDTFYHLNGKVAIWEFTNADRIQMMKYYLSIDKSTMKKEMIESIINYQLENNVKF